MSKVTSTLLVPTLLPLAIISFTILLGPHIGWTIGEQIDFNSTPIVWGIFSGISFVFSTITNSVLGCR